uniref:Uncharacterized protein n=1 Tax=Oryza sativa subsp. japonica TaxID=39947 RepID=Q8H8F5_ORYSJ|nr:hypothetical protein [Oryza sativa Japonica Group]
MAHQILVNESQASNVAGGASTGTAVTSGDRRPDPYMSACEAMMGIFLIVVYTNEILAFNSRQRLDSFKESQKCVGHDL